MLTSHQQAEFEKLARPLIEFLLMNCAPDVAVVVTNKDAQLMESAAAVALYRERLSKEGDPPPHEAANVIAFPGAGQRDS
ncbi:MAG: hypothetical protein ACO1PZ_15560 [Gammaproteobacteria bacterium]